jgi:hypothetical protein
MKPTPQLPESNETMPVSVSVEEILRQRLAELDEKSSRPWSEKAISVWALVYRPGEWRDRHSLLASPPRSPALASTVQKALSSFLSLDPSVDRNVYAWRLQLI